MNHQGRTAELASQAAQAHRLARGATDARLSATLTALGEEYDKELAALKWEFAEDRRGRRAASGIWL